MFIFNTAYPIGGSFGGIKNFQIVFFWGGGIEFFQMALWGGGRGGGGGGGGTEFFQIQIHFPIFSTNIKQSGKFKSHFIYLRVVNFKIFSSHGGMYNSTPSLFVVSSWCQLW